MQILLGDSLFTWSLSTSKRRTLQLQVTGSLSLKLTAPPHCRPEQAEAFIRSKTAWILTTAVKLAAEEAAAARFSLEPGTSLPFMGRQYTLSVAYHPVRPSVRLDGSLLRVCLPANQRGSQMALQQLLNRWYVEQARQQLLQKTREWASVIGVSPVSISIRDPKTRWGSCSSRGSLNYSWRILLAPLPVIDYLVVHELCHLRQPNHSRHFWKLVESFLPAFRESRAWLKINGGILMRLFTDVNRHKQK
ncbi:MAG: SprT family zinc-dependent metalloprotease [Sporomusaceae bacterium]|nr:SprT family zinc-dependent metalloprotease [Sporomusaceae bacterium]